MKHKGLLAALAVCAAAAFASRPEAIDLLVPKAHAGGVRPARACHTWERPGRVRCYAARSYRVRGYYSYTSRDVLASYRWINYVFTPMYGLQSPAGPFDTGFFFDSGIRPHWWNNAPYPN